MIRSFAASTVIAVVAATGLAVGLVVWCLGSLEAQGALAGRSIVAIDRLPVDRTKAENIEALTSSAQQHDVAFALVVPSRSGGEHAPAWSAFTFSGSAARPVFWAHADEQRASAIRDESLWWNYALSGAPSTVDEFLGDLGRHGFGVSVISPTARDAAAHVAGSPPVGILCGICALGTVIGLSAEAIRRAPRQRARALLGWKRRSIVLRESAEMLGITIGASVVLTAALLTFLALRGAGGATWSFAVLLLLPALAVAVGFVTVVHGALTLTMTRAPGHPHVARHGIVVVAAAGVLLSVGTVVDARAITTGIVTGDSLERQLRAEAAHGDDVILGTRGLGSADEEQALGQLTRLAIGRGEARMAATNLVENALVVSGRGTTGLDDRIGTDEPLLLVPTAVQAAADELHRAATEQFAFGWEVDEVEPGRPLDLRVVQVTSTAAIVEAVERWDTWLAPAAPSWPEIGVVVMPPDDVPSNQLATAAANGEVRFSDGGALRSAIRQAGLTDLVLTYDRVGAAVEARLATLRSDRLLLVVALVAGLIATVFAAFVLTAEHRTRTAHARRVTALAGRHPVVAHRGFVAAGAAAVGVTVGLSSTLLDDRATPSTLLSVVASAAIAAAVFIACLLCTSRTTEDPR